MLLYHGSNINIKEINLAMCRPYKDFGKGFYLTEIREQAEKMARRVARIYGGNAVLNQYEFDKETVMKSTLRIKDFGVETSEEWARFVRNNRSRSFIESDSFDNNTENQFDIVIGPIANDAMAVLFRQYENGMIDFETLLKGLEYRETTNQYSFHTERAIRFLKKVGSQNV
jgi:hypothetical protein